jgi:PAS domain S-box-containing protein
VNTRSQLERRALLLAPTGRDAQLVNAVLAEAGIRAHVCADLQQLAGEMSMGAGALLLSEEAVASEPALYFLGERLARQPPWSDLPVLLLTHPGADSALTRLALRHLGNVTLLERPVRVAALSTAVQSALRARVRQYHAREHLEELDNYAQALGESESRFKALFSNVAVGMAELAADGSLTLVNDALCQLVGAPRQQLVGRTLPSLACTADRDRLGQSLRRLFAGRIDSETLELQLERAGAGAICAKIALSLSRAAGLAGAHAVAVVEDITERKHAEEDLREADRRKDEFLATLAHELRNPLAPIRNSLHIFRMAGIQDPAVARVTGMMERQVVHMVRMVDDLLEVSRISRGKIELRREHVSLAGVLRAAVDTSLPLFEAARHRLAVAMPDESLMLDADPVRLAQVFANLLNNAAKYTPPGGEIDVNVRQEPGMAVVCVRDNGEGIPEAMLGRIFNMFTQVNTGHRAQGGLGIGLTLARTLVHLHGGDIEAHSEGAGRGCEFLVRLPLAAAAASEASDAVTRPDDMGAGLARVLVVDDNHDAADTLGMLLRVLGAQVEVVHDGPAALASLRTFRPTVVLLDLGMPGMSGIEVARRVRGDPQFASTRLVALTGWGQREDRRRTTEAGFDHHLVKPADMDALQSILALPDAGDVRDPVRH